MTTEIPPLQLETLDDGCVRVSLGDGEEMVSTIVSSMHLAAEKEAQLLKIWLENKLLKNF